MLKTYKYLLLALFKLLIVQYSFSQSRIDYFGRGNEMFDLKQYKEAANYYDSLILLDKNNRDGYFNRAIANYFIGNHIAAINDLDTLTKLDSTDFEAFFYRGYIKADYKYGKDRNLNFNPIDDYNKSLIINPNYGIAYSYRGILHMQDGNLHLAIKDCDTGIGEMPNNKFCFYNRAQVKEKLKDYTGAVKDYESAIKIDSTYILALSRSSTIKTYIIKDYAGAIIDYTLFLKSFPNSPYLYTDRGEAKLLMKDKAGACEDFKKADELGGGDQQRRLQKLIKKNCKKYR